ncbi:BtpA/SgcQ family protein [Rhizobium johnstonii]|uniref:BtpA/SgcQ family protein n=1 Tax=Rhizobium TaxID=379 RepID=UPI00102F3BD5|nr:BtpA/SgcQ family protein [Rhizobium leguminosarum]TBF70818.1 BtpA/SgcQ family protein [Rhizobium leguminosarum]TBG93313.1 BtpA/SgcQ family protein [Rhizobium leguminosarum]TBG98715.1 BtpA/SgcQ family protein [Rhizobium leguminosarum]TBH29928.1 BtpA/SgcQ family protein [Rhizobium leguminosarum]TBH50158.1 BtpA/SgcQ family protein [Rhizobium leguminosarum]
MSELTDIIATGKKPVIGMVQLPALAGGSGYRGGGFASIMEAALSEASVLAENGVDSLMVQNLGDIPVDMHATTVQVAWMTAVTAELRRRFKLPVGLNLLENDAEAMFAIASASDADFVRIKIFVGAMMTPFGMETAQAHKAIKARNSWNAGKVAIFADVHDRTGTPVASGGFIEDVEFAVRLGGADGLVLTGKTYPQTLEMISQARTKYPSVPILVGGSVTAGNFAETMTHASGAIVSTAMKGSGSAVGRFVPEKVKEFMTAAREAH